HPVGEADYFEY
nr:Chain C, 11-mer peptide from Epstein-Barr nuclear antigen 1 [synthetic construct]2FZ3_C Chain C, 11-mer peptide from Epstein-Barr nuclear antigen 1 [synthetic construct]3MV7_C Chain C, HPVG peptide from Epstein-Barr nuclear antigen 1 [synthetic construct]3MV8_C Chain C, HPVG peptide from Epstein-Barr nuclear antigen 1 [synthetic construct]3MV9_C Chain C, HPVG peptide from Epstein-Barr nuclear antigen 1 [synthetic construct]4PRI_C Chain C, Epstein-Barr nuclear antigen 1 [Human herpesvirus 4 